MAEQGSRNDLSGSVVGGHVVQVGAVHGDVTLGATERARVDHARQLREERLTTYQDFLQVALELSKDLDAEARKAVALYQAGERRSQHFLESLRTHTAELWGALDRLSTLKVRVCLVGPEGVSEAATLVCGASVALLASTQQVLEEPIGISHRWPRHHERFRDGVQDRLNLFVDEVRKVREVPPV